ncbi:hypothetical protein ACDN41_26865 [Priestia aryabhattai]|uniref:hypothetical protein n=1 Tax=Priestia aryabhattai TaxID=412384 RepID=UPI0035322190
MKQLTKTKYSTKQLCELRNIKTGTFRKNPEKYLSELKMEYTVEIEKGPNSNSPTFYHLTPLSDNEMPSALLESNGTVKLTKHSEAQIGLLLKAVLYDGIVPIHKELAKVIGKSEGTVKNRVKEMKELGILLPTPIKVERDFDLETGEIYEYERKDCYWYYYDTLPNGDIQKITDTTEVHNAYGKFFKSQLNHLKKKHGVHFDFKKGCGLADNHAKKQLDECFNLFSINRVVEWTINEDYAKKVSKECRHKSA